MTLRTVFKPTRLGDIDIANRLVMAPMSRNRADPDGNATEMMVEYYRQRSTAGLIITEGIQPSVTGKGFINTPGLHDPSHVDSWRQVTSAVHTEGGKIVAQIMHAGRIGHPSLYIDAHQSIAPSAIAAAGQAFTPDGPQDYPTPREMTREDIDQAIGEHVQAACYAIAAGFDGIEVHAGNGFLIHQFMAENTNKRNDEYGGSIAGRIRFACEVIQACADAIGAGRVGVRISPANPYNDIKEGDTQQLYRELIQKLPSSLAYLHVMEANNRHQTQIIRSIWRGELILNPHADRSSWPASAEIIDTVLETSLADAVCFGALFLANPDLVERIRLGSPLNIADETKFYGGSAAGYIDYPTLKQKKPLIKN